MKEAMFLLKTISEIYAIIRQFQFYKIQDDSKLLSGFLWPINGNPNNNLESFCIWRCLQNGHMPNFIMREAYKMPRYILFSYIETSLVIVNQISFDLIHALFNSGIIYNFTFPKIREKSRI
jgi:hypothetical protein